jgi:hypothetical protein
MKILVFPFLLLVAVTASWAAGPAISPEKPIFQFGRIAEGTKLEHTFRFKNTGDAPLIINKVRSSCGCTAALLSADTIKPGETGEVKTIFNSDGFSGSVVKTIYLHSNDPLQKVIRFQLQGQVQREIVLNPGRLQFSNLKAGVPGKATITVNNKGQNTLFLSDLKTTGNNLTAQLSAEQLAPDETAELQITLTLEPEKPRFGGYVTLRTSSPRNPHLRIPVTGHLME